MYEWDAVFNYIIIIYIAQNLPYKLLKCLPAEFLIFIFPVLWTTGELQSGLTAYKRLHLSPYTGVDVYELWEKILWEVCWVGKVNFKRSGLDEICICFCWDTSKGHSSCRMSTSCPAESWCLKPQVFFPPCLIIRGRTYLPMHVLLILRSHTCRAFNCIKDVHFWKETDWHKAYWKINKQKSSTQTYLVLRSSKSMGVEDVTKSTAGQLGSEQNPLSLRKQ